jgi:hypothetical protein
MLLAPMNRALELNGKKPLRRKKLKPRVYNVVSDHTLIIIFTSSIYIHSLFEIGCYSPNIEVF